MIELIKKLIPWVTKYKAAAFEVYAYAGMLQMVAGYSKAMLEIMRDGKITEEEGRQVVIMIKALNERTGILEANLEARFPSVKTRRQEGK